MKKKDVAKMSMAGVFCASVGAMMRARAKIALGGERLEVFEEESAKHAEKAAQALFKGEASKAGRAMAVKLLFDAQRAKHWAHTDPQTAKELSMDMLRQMQEFYGKGGSSRAVKEILLDMSEALSSGGSPGRPKGALNKVMRDKGDIALFATLKLALYAASELEVVARAANGDASWRDWMQANADVYTVKEAVSSAMLAAALEAKAKGMAPEAGVKAELSRLEQEHGAGLNLEEIRKVVRDRFERKGSARGKVDDAGRGAMVIEALDRTLAERQMELSSSARGPGLSGRLLERREIAQGVELGKRQEAQPPSSNRL